MDANILPDQVSINLMHLWLAAKVLAAIGFQWWEMKVNPGQAVHKIARRFLLHCAVNPEWSMLKLIAFLPAWIFTGVSLSKWLMPSTAQYNCAVCRDKGYSWREVRGNDGETRITKMICSCTTTNYWQRVANSYKGEPHGPASNH